MSNSHRLGAVYAIVHLRSGALYVGSSVNVKQRWENHRTRLKCGTHTNKKLQAAWAKYGHQEFEFSILEDRIALAMLRAREQAWIDGTLAATREGGFNLCPIAGSFLGRKHSEATKEKCRAAKLGRPAPAHVAENLRAFNEGRVFTKEHREAIGVAHRGRKRAAEAVEKTAAAHRGKKRSEETRAKMSAASAGNTKWLGRKHTEEAKRKQSEARGNKATWSKLTADDVANIRRQHASGSNGAEIARGLGVTKQAVYSILKGKTWRAE